LSTVTLGYVHPGSISHEFHESLFRVHDMGVTNHIIAAKSGPLISVARNEVINAYLHGTDDDFFLCADTDMRFDPGDIKDLVKLHLPIVSGLCVAVKQSGATYPVGVFKNDEGHMEKFSYETLYSQGKGKKKLEVLGVGMAFTLIKRKVIADLFDKKPEDVILWPYAETEQFGADTGEDITFCLRAGEIGYKSYIALDVPVGHLKPMMLWPEGRPDEQRV